MGQTVSVDCSAKVEQWSKDTALAFSNSVQGSVLVKKKVKQQARNWLKRHYPHRSSSFYTFQLFAAFVCLLIKPHLSAVERLQIDRDYPGQQTENILKAILLNFFQHINPSLRKGFIQFRGVKGSKADRLARSIFQQQQPADRIISFEEIQALFISPKK